jgi:hypothetical protein
MIVETTPTSVTTHRQYAFNDLYVLSAEYPELRTFYSQFETNDQQSVVLKATATPTTTAAISGGGN